MQQSPPAERASVEAVMGLVDWLPNAKFVMGVASLVSAVWWTMSAYATTPWSRKRLELNDNSVVRLQAKLNAYAALAAAVAALASLWA